jgi:hypothetical protein
MYENWHFENWLELVFAEVWNLAWSLKDEKQI